METLAGLAIGAVVGLLLGLSTSPVVSATLAALLALVTTFVGLGGAVGPVSANASAKKLLAFSIGLGVFLVLGVIVRSHQLLAPSPQQQVAAWEAAGFDQERAQALATFERLGILPAGAETAEVAATPTTAGLFSDSANSADCGLLARDRYGSPQNRLKAMLDIGGPWSGAATASSLSDDKLNEFLETVWRVQCEN